MLGKVNDFHWLGNFSSFLEDWIFFSCKENLISGWTLIKNCYGNSVNFFEENQKMKIDNGGSFC